MPRILLADDNEANRYYLERILSNAGHDVTAFKNGEELISEFERQKPDLIITDVQMPVLDGFHLVEKLRSQKEYDYIPIIIISATYKDMRTKVKGIELGASDYLTYPVDEDELLAKLKSLLHNKALYEKFRLQAEIVSNMSEGVYVCRLSDGVITYSNPRFEEMFGYDPGEMLGKHVSLVNAPTEKDPKETTREIMDFIEKNGYWRGEINNIKKDGTSFWCYASVSVLDHSKHGKVLVSTHTDITEHRKARQELENIFNLSPDMVCICTPDGGFVKVNPSCEGILGYTIEEIIELGWAKLVHPNDAEVTRSEVEKQLNDMPVMNFTNRFRCKDGTYKTLEWQATPVIDGVVYATARDITERKRAEEQIRNAEQKLFEQQRHEKESVETELAKVRDELIRKTRLATIGQISASIAHDLRNPLGSVRNASYFLKRYFSNDDPKFVEYLAIIDEEIETSNRIISNLLSLARAKEPAKETVDLGPTLGKALERVGRTETLRCRISLVPDPFCISADPDQLGQVIANVANNAVQAMDGRGELSVEATRDSDYDTIVFRDTGTGFEPEIRDKLFEPLITTKAKGTGLGLAICRQIIERHGGTIDAVETEGQGAAIRIRLPRQQPQPVG